MKSRKRLFIPDFGILEAMLADAGLACNTSTCRDRETLRSRLEHEGVSFLTITLPNFARGFERSLEQGRWLPEHFTGFKNQRGLCLPAFLQGFTSLVFDSKKGALHDSPSIDAVEAVRQLCLCFNKIEADCTEARRRSAELAYESCEAEVARFRVKDWDLGQTFGQVSRLFFAGVFRAVDDLVNSQRDVPVKHGPGTTVGGITGNGKYRYRTWSRRLSVLFPVDAYWFVNQNELVCEIENSTGISFEYLSQKDEPPAEVRFVPKTQKAPRVIAIEPVYNQYVQQGLMRALVHLIERDKRLKGQINFTKQSINGALALSSSITREFATIDLKEASDRINAGITHLMVQTQPNFCRAVFACRSKYAKLPNGKVIPMKKFASQGSAVTFPLEAMVFFGIAIASFAKHHGLPVHHQRVKDFSRKVFVYGDDIIVPTKEVDTVLAGLRSAGLVVNPNKLFVQSHFRESCGVDAFLGHIVTPVYIRKPEPKNKRDAASLLASISTANQFYLKGYWKTSQYLRSKVEKLVGFVPHVLRESPLCGWYSFQGHYSVMRWNSDTQCFETRGITTGIKKKADRLEGYRALAKYFTEGFNGSPVRRSTVPLKVLGTSATETQMNLPLGDEECLDLLDGADLISHERRHLQAQDFDPILSGSPNFNVLIDIEGQGGSPEESVTASFGNLRYPLSEDRFAVTSRRGAVYTKLRWASPI